MRTYREALLKFITQRGKGGTPRNIKSLQVVFMEAPPGPLSGSLGKDVWGE